jgi:hypothetical protein
MRWSRTSAPGRDGWRMARWLAVVVAIACAAAPAHAQVPPPAQGGGSAAPTVIKPPLELGAPDVSAAASPTAVSLGTAFTLFVTAAFDAGVEVNLREPMELGPAFEVRRRDVRDSVRADGKHVREWQLEVLAWELGDLAVPPVAVTFTFGGHAGQVDTNRVPIRVDGVLGEVVDDKAMRPLAPPTALTSRDWFWLYVATAVGAIVGAVVLLLLSRRRGEVVVEHPIVVHNLDTPGNRALARLMAIERSGVLSRAVDRKRGYDAMVDVIREYLGERFRVATRDLTSAELLRRLAGVAGDVEHGSIGAWLGRCDVVKYGGVQPSEADARGVLDDARAMVVATTPGKTAPDPAEPAGKEAA